MSFRLISFLIFGVFFYHRGNAKDQISYSIDTNQIALKRLSRLLLPSEVIKNKKIKKLQKEQANSWIKPISLSGDMGNDCRLISYQGQTKQSYLLILAQVFEEFNNSDIEPYGLDQYLVSVDKKTGKLLSGIILQGYFSGDKLDSTIAGKGKVLNLRIINSSFAGNKIHVKYRTDILISPEKDLEEESSKTYIIKEDGMIKVEKKQ